MGQSSQLFATTWYEHINNNNNIKLHSHKQSLQSEFKVFQHLKTNKRHFSKSIESQWFHIFSKKKSQLKKVKMVHIKNMSSADSQETVMRSDSGTTTGPLFPGKPVLNCGDQPAELDPYIYIVLTSL